MIVRLSKLSLVFAIGVFSLLVGYCNIVDYQTNFEYVQHVLSMDTTFPGHALKSRAITSSNIHHLAYWVIIATEFLVGVLCILGSLKLLKVIRKSAREFMLAKSTAIVGLVSGFGLWFFGFMTVGAEWFQMWQSQIWNGQEAAFRTLASIGIVLIFLNQTETE